MPPRTLTAADDPRIVALAINNASDSADGGNRYSGDRTQGEIPRAWRAKGYEPVAALMGAWYGRSVDTGTLRHNWRADLTDGRSRRLPAPDAVIKRGPRGELLPGWADETIIEWLTNRPARTYLYLEGQPRESFSKETFEKWEADQDEIDPRLVNLIAGNEREYGHAFNDAEPYDGVPAAYLTLGYEAASKLMTAAQGSGVSNSTVRHYWGIDLNRVHPTTGDRIPYSRRLPIPDAVIERGKDSELLPGWTRQTILDWLPRREGPGNHTSGEDRRGFNEGRTGLTKVGVDEQGKGIWVRVPVSV
jgi:hypothetical protein